MQIYINSYQSRKKRRDPIPTNMLIPVMPNIKAVLPLSGIGGAVILGVGEVSGAVTCTPVGTITIAVGANVGVRVGAAVAVGSGVAVGRVLVGVGVGVGRVVGVGSTEGSVN